MSQMLPPDGAGQRAAAPRITIVTPSLNQGAFLETALGSVLSQGYPNLEHIVMDGGSTDGSLDILDRWASRLAHVESAPDEGQTDALAKGFARSTGEILGWLNADDVLEPRALHEVAAFFDANPRERFVFGDAIWIDTNDRVIRRKREMPFVRFVWLRTYDYIPQPSAFWRRSLYDEVGGLDRSFDLAMDADLFARMAERTPLRHVARTWSRMRAHPDQRNVRFRAKSNAEEARIRSRYIQKTDGPRWAAERLIARAIRVAYRAALGAYWR